MPVSQTICPRCGYEWTMVAGVARSWHCPRCGGARYKCELTRRCRCGHKYQEHDHVWFQNREPQRTIGRCSACDCEHYDPADRSWLQTPTQKPEAPWRDYVFDIARALVVKIP
ncbi:MAG: anaerobic ribonucleoside-triphosphate reductase [Chloroflexi bacterium]|nr:anaerobic ribonucleoside-triphosphate reductase [Chloroflexota bacterium]